MVTSKAASLLPLNVTVKLLVQSVLKPIGTHLKPRLKAPVRLCRYLLSIGQVTSGFACRKIVIIAICGTMIRPQRATICACREGTDRSTHVHENGSTDQRILIDGIIAGCEGERMVNYRQSRPLFDRCADCNATASKFAVSGDI